MLGRWDDEQPSWRAGRYLEEVLGGIRCIVVKASILSCTSFIFFLTRGIDGGSVFFYFGVLRGALFVMMVLEHLQYEVIDRIKGQTSL